MKLDPWQELDDRAVAISRALAMDAVQKVGNGHPGTAMSLAPVAYTLFQRILYPLLWPFIINFVYSIVFIWIWP